MTREEILKQTIESFDEGDRYVVDKYDVKFIRQDIVLKAMDNYLSLPPAEGATDKFRDVLNEVQRLIEINDGATGGELRAIWNSLSCAITESEKKPHPTAEGAEEIQPTAYEWHNYKTGHCYVDYIPHLDAKEGYVKTPLYTTLHAQRIAEKTVSEKLREELARFWAYQNAMGVGDDIYSFIETYLNERR